MTKTFSLVLSNEAPLTTALLPDPLLSLLRLLSPPLIPLLFDAHLSLVLSCQPEIPVLLHPLLFDPLTLRRLSMLLNLCLIELRLSLLLLGAELNVVIFHMDSGKKVILVHDAFCAEARIVKRAHRESAVAAAR
jgi:hypothetical protein